MYYNSLSLDSQQRIQNIANGFRAIPAYSSYQLRTYVYDPLGGVYAIEISRYGNIVNLFLFFPDNTHTGKIGSIALYGANLQGHYNAMKSSMMCFGMPISDISFESGMENYLDITLDY